MGADLEAKVLSGGGRPYSSLRQGHHRKGMSEGSPVGKLTAYLHALANTRCGPWRIAGGALNRFFNAAFWRRHGLQR
jgi:hypothetical protein